MLSYDDRFLRFSFAIDQIAKNLQKIKNEKLVESDSVSDEMELIKEVILNIFKRNIKEEFKML
mgnify:CR=1 FL=1